MSNTLVAYFSATGTTKKLAENLAESISSDIFEIKPKISYTSDDLDWLNKNSRSSVEMRDKSARPEILDKLEDITQYDIIYLAFPIWWYTAPRIINTFLEQYDFSGKTIVTLATSGGSSLGNTNKDLAALCFGADLKEGKVFSADTVQSDLKAWAEQFF